SQPADQPRSQHDGEDQCGETRHGGAKSVVLEQPEWRQGRIRSEKLFVKEPIKHLQPSPSTAKGDGEDVAVNSSRAFSTRTPRDPLKRITSPGCARSRSMRPASTGSS